MERLNGAAKALVEFDWDGLDDLKSDITLLEDSMTAALGINYQLQFNTKKSSEGAVGRMATRSC